MKIATKSIAWTDDQNLGEGVSAFYIFYSNGGDAQFSYDLPYVAVPAVKGQADYVFTLPGGIPLSEGTWTLWIAPGDAEGNIGDPVSVTRFFDFTPPRPVSNLRIL
jgi:hypothetical protein